MQLPTGYTLTGPVYPARGGLLARATREKDGTTVLVCGTTPEAPLGAMLQHFDAELEAATLFDGVARPLRRLDGDRRSWLVYEDVHGEPLELTHPWGLHSFWELAPRLALALAEHHRNGRVHGRLEGSCVWWDPKRPDKVAIFGCVPPEQSGLIFEVPATPDTAPELLGTRGAPVQPSADVYSLGCIFYRLLSGRSPIATTGSLAFDVAANAPQPLDPDRVPRPLSDLVLRMLSKSPSARPQHAGEVCKLLATVRAGGSPPRLSIRLLPSVLVGRAAELDALVVAARLVSEGGSKLVCLLGEPGVGKSYLLSAFLRRLPSATFLVADGRFEQVNQGQPYSALLSACRNAVGYALSGDESVFTNTRTRLLEANRALLAVLAPYVQELKHLCQPLPEPPDVGASENRNRFKRACLELLSALASPELPFVLVLDDVQWADDATAALLSELIASRLPERLLLVLSYRPRDAEQNPDLRGLLKVLPAESRMQLEPFQSAQTEEFCRSLIPNCEAMPSLASAVQQRSGGNALYCIELIRSLAASGELAQEGDRWSFTEGAGQFTPVSETVIELIRARLVSESEATRYLMGAAGCIGSAFSLELLAEATALDAAELRDPLATAVRHGLIEHKPVHSSRYAFCHDQIQETALTLLRDDQLSAVRLRLGRYYRKLADTEQSALFHCLDQLNPVRYSLDAAERAELCRLNWQGARRARRAIAYKRCIAAIVVYLESEQLLADERFEATLLLAECHLLSLPASDDPEAQRTVDSVLNACAALARTTAQRLEILRMRLSICVSNQSYAAAVDLGLSALELLGHPLPPNPTLARVIAAVLWLQARMRGADTARLLERPDAPAPVLHSVTDILMRLSAPAHWERPALGALVLARLVDITLRHGNGPQSSMAYACYGFICHMQGNHELGLRYGRLAEVLARGHSPYTRSMVRFQTLTFFGAFELEPRALLSGYDAALVECVSHGELIASHLIDGAVTTLPYYGPKLPKVLDELERYEREARNAGAAPSLEMIELVRHWCTLLRDGPPAADGRTRGLYAKVTHESFSAGRDLLRMQVEYLAGNDEAALELAAVVRKNPLLNGNPLHRASYAIFAILATTRSQGKLTRTAREALRFLERLDEVRVEDGPRNFRASLLLARGVCAHTRGRLDASELLENAVGEAARAGQDLIRAIGLERLAYVEASRGRYAQFTERLRDAAQAFQQFGASSKVRELVEKHPGIDWSHLVGRQPKQLAVQVEGVMRAASAIAEVTSTAELGPTLLRVIAATAGALRAFLFVPQDGKFTLVAGCERDQVETNLEVAPLDEIDADYLPLRVVRYVERSREAVELPRDQLLFAGDPYLEKTVPQRALLCVPLLYRAELVAILYLEGSCNADTFSADDTNLVTLLGRHAAIALSNADAHRLEVEALQSKVNPHFLYNALSVIAELIGHSPAAAEDAVFKLTKLYRYMLSTSATQRVSLENELALVRDYLELEKARFGERLKVSWDVQADVSRFQVPALLIQPLVENAVNHGVRRNMNGGTVSISVRERGEGLVLTVRDDGPGWYAGSGGTGFGLRSVRRRLELVYADRAQLEIVKRDGVAVELTLPW